MLSLTDFAKSNKNTKEKEGQEVPDMRLSTVIMFIKLLIT